MTTTRFTVPKQRLAELMRKPGGVPVEEALAAAGAVGSPGTELEFAL